MVDTGSRTDRGDGPLDPSQSDTRRAESVNYTHVTHYV
jgi:hypothetical protein